jgi:glycosyltransferase involved in cell wall biosynthesis
MPLVSIVVPAYDEGESLDDGSTDDSRAALDALLAAHTCRRHPAVLPLLENSA